MALIHILQSSQAMALKRALVAAAPGLFGLKVNPALKNQNKNKK
jgi:hypothetical protein